MGQEITREDLQGVNPPPEGGEKGGEKPPFNPNAGDKPAELQGGPKEPEGGEPKKEVKPSVVEEYIYPNDDSVPEPLRGKKASEAVGVFNTLQTLSQGVVKQLRTIQEQNANKPKEPAKPIFDKDEFVTGEPDKIEEKLSQLFETKATPFMVDMYSGLSSMAMVNAENAFPYFKKYKAEIMAEASQMPVNKTAHLNTWKEIHDRVASRHVNEIAADLNNSKPPAPVVERGGGDPPGGGGETEMDADDRKIADGMGVSYSEFKKFKKLYSSAE